MDMRHVVFVFVFVLIISTVFSASMIQIRRDTAANWTTADPTLAQGELGFETDTLKLKMGNGITAWTSLPYYHSDTNLTGYLTIVQGDTNYWAKTNNFVTKTLLDGNLLPYITIVQADNNYWSKGNNFVTKTSLDGNLLPYITIAQADTNYLWKGQDTNCQTSGSCSLIAYLDRNNTFDSGTLFVDADHSNIGIGTTNPILPLEIEATTGAMKINSSTGTNRSYIQIRNTGGYNNLGMESSTGGALWTGTSPYAAVFGHSGAYPIQFLTNGTVKQTITSDGNIGIGTASPVDMLVLQIPTNKTKGIYFQDVTTTGYGVYLRYDENNNLLKIAGNQADNERLGISILRDSGNVGIGNTSPGVKLDITGSTRTSDNFFAGTGTSEGLYLWTDTSGASIIHSGTNNTGITLTSKNNDPITLTGGNVGIGTSTPTGNLQLTYAGEPNLILQRNDTTINANDLMGIINWYSNDAQLTDKNYLAYIKAVAPISYTSAATYGQLEFGTADGTDPITRMLINRSGNVGIGTTTPQNKLNVIGDANVVGNSYITGNLGLGTTSTSYKLHVIGEVFASSNLFGNVIYSNTFRDQAGGSIALQDDAGNVGIGTPTPSYPLHVDSNVSNISIYADANISAMGYITHTQTFNKTRGTALSFIKDADEYKTNGRVDDEKFSYSKVVYNKTVPDKIVTTRRDFNECTPTPPIIDTNTDTNVTITIPQPDTCKIVQQDINVQTFKIIQETGVSIDSEIALLKQAIFEIKQCINQSNTVTEIKGCVNQ